MLIALFIAIGYLLCGFICHVVTTVLNKLDTDVDDVLPLSMVILIYVLGPFGLVFPFTIGCDMVFSNFKPIDRIVTKIMSDDED